MTKTKFFKEIDLISIFFLFVILLQSCSDKIDEQHSSYVEPMLYSIDLMMQTYDGVEGNESIVTRGIDYGNSHFTNEYTDEYIYIHSADSYTDDRHQVLAVPLEDNVEACGDSKCGIHLQIEVHKDQSYTITAEGNSINIAAGQKVYFSNILTAQWEAEFTEDASPITQDYDIFKRSGANKELLRSATKNYGSRVVEDGNYTVDDLLALAVESPQIPLSRHCTGLRVNLMFSKADKYGGGYTLHKEDLADFLSESSELINLGLTKENLTIDHFYIKLYLGPSFCHTFDMYNKTVPDSDEGGFYVSGSDASHENTYRKFAEFKYTKHKESDDNEESTDFRGVGYRTLTEEILLSPLNLNISSSTSFIVYAFVKYIEDPTTISEEELNSNEGSFYFNVQLTSLDTQPNKIHRAVLVFNYEELANVVKWTLDPNTFPTSETSSQTLTRGLTSSDSPKRIDAEPLKIFSEIE